jgi:phosphonate transport system substrate-binding protein
MSTRVLAAPLAVGVLAAAPLVIGARLNPGADLVLAVLPCANIETTFRKFHPLLTYLQSSTGLRLRLTLPADFTEFETATANGQLDLVLQDPHTYQRLSHLFDDASLLQTLSLEATTRQSAVVVVRRDSRIDDLTELRGKTVLFGPRTSSPKWVAAKLLFESRGLHVTHDLKGTNGGCCEDIAFAVSVKAADAGVICDHFLSRHVARQRDLGVDPASLTIIGRTRAFPTRILASRRGVPAAVVESVTRALLRLDPAHPGHAGILASAEIRGFLRTTRSGYLEGLSPGAPP